MSKYIIFIYFSFCSGFVFAQKVKLTVNIKKEYLKETFQSFDWDLKNISTEPIYFISDEYFLYDINNERVSRTDQSQSFYQGGEEKDLILPSEKKGRLTTMGLITVEYSDYLDSHPVGFFYDSLKEGIYKLYILATYKIGDHYYKISSDTFRVNIISAHDEKDKIAYNELNKIKNQLKKLWPTYIKYGELKTDSIITFIKDNKESIYAKDLAARLINSYCISEKAMNVAILYDLIGEYRYDSFISLLLIENYFPMQNLNNPGNTIEKRDVYSEKIINDFDNLNIKTWAYDYSQIINYDSELSQRIRKKHEAQKD